ncbi:MAG: hypothetical protein JGK04_17725 [Microcoleus sp. PH2017_39_LGB_O_B]|uniref:hypothetical protein n=1 Tax=unclassified Microcoleus TaxID=2642155 RepID=UPI001DABC368|nr:MULTISPECIES: hypothetical protein [unclassified Microcoleus]MCC3449243.1 hypothetical protein [Microcoleus sp. PH2017_09_SFU_O_A]MCC3630226.1 hypothetical protein [Microcoleus sp. PH2017_39_LGB_O_B]MCC3642304.1 hypothetical protein [Microcoleus sp. PH2017_33_LGB_O_A]
MIALWNIFIPIASFFQAIALFPQITKRAIAFPMSNPKVRSPLFSESAIGIFKLRYKLRNHPHSNTTGMCDRKFSKSLSVVKML